MRDGVARHRHTDGNATDLRFRDAGTIIGIGHDPALLGNTFPLDMAVWGNVRQTLAALNASTLYGIQPIWAKGKIDRRDDILAEKWNAISRVKARRPIRGPAPFWGVSPVAPVTTVDTIMLEIDNDAATWITRFSGNVAELDYMGHELASLPAELRQGGSAAIIGVGGGRDVLSAIRAGFKRIVGIEVNPAIADLTTRRFARFSGLGAVPGFEMHVDEGRSYLTRSGESFDLIQATLVDTWAGTAAGAMALTENSLYTVEAWRLFYRHLKPGGIIACSRWYWQGEAYQSRRLFSLAWATLLAEGVARPEDHIAFLTSTGLATLMLSNAPLSPTDLDRLRAVANVTGRASSWVAVSRAAYWLGLMHADAGAKDDVTKASFAIGVEAARKAGALDAKDPGAPYWEAVNLASMAEISGVVSSAGQLPTLMKLMNRTSALDPNYFYGGVDRFWGTVITRTPGFLVRLQGRSSYDAEKFFQQSLKTAPSMVSTRVFMAELLMKEGEREKALQLLREAAAIPAVTDAELEPWNVQARMVARKRLAELEKK